MIKQAFILAAGRGERMRPLTDSMPKPLVKISGKSMLDRAIEKVVAIAEIEKIVVNAFYLSEMIENHIANLGNNKIIVSTEKNKLETGGGLLQALKFFNSQEPILLINSDIVWKDENNAALKKNNSKL
jgi:MurNAc alpha-1-phosphate uridylyltransferase